MTRLPRTSARECISALERAGFAFQRQRGSHYIMRHQDSLLRVVVPLHDALGPGMLRAILRDADLTPQQFIELLR